MASGSHITLYEQIVDVAKDYLGPAGERFIRRQIVTHIGVEPEQIRKQDLKKLVDWTRLTIALLTNDASHVDSFADRLSDLAQPKKANHGKSQTR